MTKSKEIEILTAVAESLKDGYCGDWLAEQIPYIQQAIDSDMEPEYYAITIRDATERVANIVQSAQADSVRIIDGAKKQAAQIVAEARTSADNLRWHAASSLKEALKLIQ